MTNIFLEFDKILKNEVKPLLSSVIKFDDLSSYDAKKAAYDLNYYMDKDFSPSAKLQSMGWFSRQNKNMEKINESIQDGVICDICKTKYPEEFVMSIITRGDGVDLNISGDAKKYGWIKPDKDELHPKETNVCLNCLKGINIYKCDECGSAVALNHAFVITKKLKNILLYNPKIRDDEIHTCVGKFERIKGELLCAKCAKDFLESIFQYRPIGHEFLDVIAPLITPGYNISPSQIKEKEKTVYRGIDILKKYLSLIEGIPETDPKDDLAESFKFVNVASKLDENSDVFKEMFKKEIEHLNNALHDKLEEKTGKTMRTRYGVILKYGEDFIHENSINNEKGQDIWFVSNLDDSHKITESSKSEYEKLIRDIFKTVEYLPLLTKYGQSYIKAFSDFLWPVLIQSEYKTKEEAVEKGLVGAYKVKVVLDRLDVDCDEYGVTIDYEYYVEKERADITDDLKKEVCKYLKPKVKK